MKGLLFFWIIICLLFPFAVDGQGVKIGDKCPNFELNFDGQLKRVPISIFKGKLVIIDFWGTYCKSCIESFPKLDSLKKMYNEKIEIILVTEDSKEKVEKFFAVRKKIRKPSVHMITDDSLLTKYFPHDGVPFHVWINEEGRVYALASGHNTNSENLDKYFSGKPLHLYEKKKVVPYNWDIPLVFKDTSVLNKVKSFSYLMPYVDSLRPALLYKKSKDGLVKRIICNGCSALELFLKAYNEGGKHKFSSHVNNVTLFVSDSSLYTFPKDENTLDEWVRSNSYLYDLSVPENKADLFYKIMQADLEKSFELHAKVEKKNIKCIALVKTNQEDKLFSKGGARLNAFRKYPFDSQWVFQNQPFSFFASRIEAVMSAHKYPLVFMDLTGYKGNVDIVIKADFVDKFDMNDLRKDLRKYGLDLIEKEIVSDVLIIKEESVNTFASKK